MSLCRENKKKREAFYRTRLALRGLACPSAKDEQRRPHADMYSATQMVG